MCWISNEKPVRLIAEKDIPVFKIGKIGGFMQQVLPYFYVGYGVSSYREGKTYSVLEEILPVEEGILPNRYTILRGLHSYNVRNIRLKGALMFDGLKTPCVQTTTLRTTPQCTDVLVNGQLYLIDGAAVILCYIPKGTAYYINKIGEMVSEKLTIVKLIKEPFSTNKDDSTSVRSVDRINEILDNWENGKI